MQRIFIKAALTRDLPSDASQTLIPCGDRPSEVGACRHQEGALTAPRGKQWICDTCQSVHEEWGPVCPNCGGFDTLSWRDAPHATTTLPHGAEMLPLIVGKPQIDEAEEVEEPVAEDAQVAETCDVEEAEVLPLDDAVAMARKTV